jgi:hypothetical protein
VDITCTKFQTDIGLQAVPDDPPVFSVVTNKLAAVAVYRVVDILFWDILPWALSIFACVCFFFLLHAVSIRYGT